MMFLLGTIILVVLSILSLI